MKKSIHILIVLMGASFYLSAQSVGDYRSVSSGNWNDPAKWEIYNGSSWIAASSYPGQNATSGAVTINVLHEIKVTATVPNAISSLLTDQLNYYPPEGNVVNQIGVLTFSSENPVTLTVFQDVVIHGELRIDDQAGMKSHTLSVGGSLVVGTKIICDDCYICEYIPATFHTIDHDDKLSVVFAGGGIIDSGSEGIEFQDITFNGGTLTVITPVYIRGKATFLNGIVQPLTEPVSHNADCQIYYTYRGLIFFHNGATVSGGSNASFVDGPVSKEGGDPFTFPIGNKGVYAPLTISGPSSDVTIAGAGYVRYNAADFGPISDPGLFSISNCEYWSFDSGGFPVDVTVGWSPASGCGTSPYISNPSEVTLAHFNFSTWRWDSHGGSGIGTTTNGSVTWAGINGGLITLANLSNTCNAPWGSATNITSNSATLSWTAIAGAASYDVDYKPYTSNDWINVATATTATSVSLTGLSPYMPYDWRIRTNCSSSSSLYRQNQFTTICGVPSGLSATNITSSSATISWLDFPNNSTVSNYGVEYKQSGSDWWIAAQTTNLSITLTGLNSFTKYDVRVRALCRLYYWGNYAQTSFTTLQAPCVDLYENNNSSAQAKAINLGVLVSANIFSANDVDWFKVTTPNNSNTNLEVTLSGLPADYDLYVYNKNLNLIGSSLNSGTSNEVVTYNSNARKATYFIKVAAKSGAFNASLCYNLLSQALSGRTALRSSDPVKEITGESDTQLLFPNPASEVVYVGFNSTVEGPADLQIFNTTGELKKLNSIKITRGYNQVMIPVSDIYEGMYFLRISRGGLNITRKFVIAR